MAGPCDWPARRSECAVLASLIQPRAFTPHLHVHGPAHTGKTRLLLAVLRSKQCLFAFVDCLAVTSQRAALASIARQLDVDDSSGAAPSRVGLSELATRLRALPQLLVRTAFVVVKHVHALPVPAAERDDWLAGLLSLSDACQRHVTVILVDRGTDPSGGGRTATLRHCLLPVHFAAYGAAELAAIITRSLLSDAASATAASTATAATSAAVAEAALFRFVADVVNAFLGATRDLRELHRLVALLLRRTSDTAAATVAVAVPDALMAAATDTATTASAAELISDSSHVLYGMRREVNEVTAGGVHRFEYVALPSKAVEEERQYRATAELTSWARLLSRHLSLSQFYLLFASYIASHNSTQDDRRLFANEATRVSQPPLTLCKGSASSHFRTRSFVRCSLIATLDTFAHSTTGLVCCVDCLFE